MEKIDFFRKIKEVAFMHNSKKRLISALTAAVAFAGCMPSFAVFADETADNDIDIYFTNDVHCEYLLYDKVAEIVKDNDLLIDAGDNIQGGLVGTLSDGGYMVDIMNYMGYDAAVPGNHEFDYGMDRFLEIAKGTEETPKLANADYLSCNFFDSTTGETVLDPYKIYDVNGTDVAVVGISTPETITKTNPSYFQDEEGNWIYDFAMDETGELLYSTVQDTVDEARAAGADYVVAVGHLGVDLSSSPWMSTEVIANTTGIDVFIDGHSHTEFSTTAKNEDGEEVPTVQTGTKLANVGKVTIAEDGEITTELIPITEESPADADTTAFLNEVTSRFEETQNQVVAQSEVKLTTVDPETGERLIRTQETNLGDFCADAYRAVAGADIAFVNGGGIRADIEEGDVTFGDIVAVHPYGNELVLAEVTGQQILDALEWGSRGTPVEEIGGFQQVSGLSYEVHTYIDSPCVEDEYGAFASVGEGERRVKNVKVGGEDIDPEATYKLAGHNYMLLSYGDGFNMFKDCTILAESMSIDNQVLIDYMTDYLDGVVTADSIYSNPYGEGRITLYEEEPAPTPTVKPTATPTASPTASPAPTPAGPGSGTAGTGGDDDNDDIGNGSGTVSTGPATPLMTPSPAPTAAPANDTPFNDVSSSDWFYSAVKYVYENGIMNGVVDTQFAPDMTTTRGMLVTMLYRMEGSPAAEAAQFADVAADSYYASAIAWANAAGIVEGYDENTFAPDDSITREQMATILYRYAGLKGIDTSARGDLAKFTDASAVSGYAVDAMAWANGAGLVNGVTDTELSPQGGAVRSQVAAMLMRFDALA